MAVDRYNSASLSDLKLHRNGHWVHYSHYRRLKKKLNAAELRISELEQIVETRTLIEEAVNHA